ncbi:MAG: DUF2169 domain-containing protein, partial [Polyangiaceae bacterium]|nr:DUF2169 domain-containing protein [Polyangiaceae bacterium]
MEVVSLSPLPVGSVAWQPRQGTWVLTFACKATFRLLPGRADLAEEQEPLYREDRHWSDDPGWSLYAPNDLAPARRRADVVLVGEAFAPAGKPARTLITRLRVGEIDKRVEVWGDRSMGPDGAFFEGARFTRMPLLWERAAGGPETSNPVGVRLDARDAYGRRILPNLVPPGVAVRKLEEAIEPAGFGPISPSWPARQAKLGRYAGSYAPDEWARRPLPPGIDAAYFSAAPWDQQAEKLREDERLVLDHLHPDHPHLATQLPGHHPRAFVTRPGRGGQPVPMQIELLWIRTDVGLCTVTWRGQVRLDRADEEGRVLVALEEAGQTLAWEDIVGGSAAAAEPTHDEEPPFSSMPAERTGQYRPLMPTLSNREDPVLPFSAPKDTALPFSAPTTAAAPLRPEDPAQRLAGTPFSPAPPPVAPPPIAPPPIAPPPVAPPPIAPPPAIAAPPPVVPPPRPSSPGVMGAAAPPGFAPPPPIVRPQGPRTIGEAAAGSPSPLFPSEGPGASSGALGAS